MTYSDIITRYRKARGWTQRDLAHRLDMTVVTVASWEQGTKRPTIASRMALAELLEIPQPDILPEFSKLDEKMVSVNEPDLVNLVEVCRDIPVETRPMCVRVMLAVADEWRKRAPQHALPE